MGPPVDLGKMGFGCMGLTAFYGPPVSNEKGVAVLKAAHEAGTRMFDTAQLYQQTDVVPGTFKHNEELVGEFLKTVDRDSVTVATKFFPAGMYEGKPVYSFELLEKAADQSLKHLGIDCIDIFYLHRMYPEEIVPIETIAADMKKLVEKGKIKEYGLSEVSPAWLRRAHSVYPPFVIQQEWSLFSRDLEEDIVPTAQELGVKIVAYSPIARGLLSGALTEAPKEGDFRTDAVPYFSPENLAANRKLVNIIEELAKDKECTPAQICLAWVMSKGAVPIPGTTKEERAKSNFEATKIELTPEEIEKMEALGSQVKGLRADEGLTSINYKAQM